MAYATRTDLAAYMGKDESELPQDADRLLERASELVDAVTLGRVNQADAAHREAAKKATCAQVEHWLTVGEEAAIAGHVKAVSLGSLSIQYADAQGGPATLAPRARMALLMAGLLYRGVTC